MRPVRRIVTSFGHAINQEVDKCDRRLAGWVHPPEGARMPRNRSIVLLLVLVAAAAGVWMLLSATNDQSSSTVTTTQPLPPARSLVKDVPPGLVPTYQAAAAECPRVPWTFYAAMGKLSSDHGRDLPAGQVRVEEGLVRGLVTLTEEHWVRFNRGGRYDSPEDTLVTVARLLCSGPAPQGVTTEVGLAIRYVTDVPTGRVGGLLAQADAYARLYG
jgi:hypothetical protein